ncbi:Rieske (2Fe-2S) protein [Jannaschia sp. LMIT008]|uniref:Rieske (2Fe-2S) protein n=1 Tax=Jannaschia maritima TaxID=3032585 RepID=UPI002810E170|nr:Rieske (2Fe-2S) protein [Jannaschia sp. LMIT008]
MRWTAVMLAADLPPGAAAGTTVDGTDLAVWRSASGAVHAWTDRCPHRGMRLSHGFVRGETLACIYHGWRYGTDGACRHIPAHPSLTPPKTIAATDHACREAGGLIWVGGTGEPPVIEHPHPVRSLEVAAPPEAVARAFGAAEGVRVLDLDGRAATLALQPVASAATRIHALCARPDDRLALSRALDARRARAEGDAA